MMLSLTLRNITNNSITLLNRNAEKSLTINRRELFGYVRVAFNKVDEDRLKLVGPDCLCAEWVVKNGGSVSFANNNHLIKDYGILQASISGQPKLKVIDGTDSSIMALGFEHLKNCKYIDKIILNRCQHMENSALDQLAYVKDTLNVLQVTDCGNVENSGLSTLKQLTNLKLLILYGFIYVEDFQNIINVLQKNLPKCQIITERPEQKQSKE